MTAVIAGEELVVLCGPDGSFAGTAVKRSVHHADTPLHLAFSCYLFDRDGRVLVTRRAFGKPTWPGVRTNSCCGHPAPGEAMPIAVTRRLQQELGIRPDAVELVLPRFRYRARMADGMVENELCPVYRAVTTDTRVVADQDEVAEAWWTPWEAFVSQIADADTLSPWSALQVAELRNLGARPDQWPTARDEELPAAARMVSGVAPAPFSE